MQYGPFKAPEIDFSNLTPKLDTASGFDLNHISTIQKKIAASGPEPMSSPAMQSTGQPSMQQTQAPFAQGIPGAGLPNVNNPIQTAQEVPQNIPQELPETGAGEEIDWGTATPIASDIDRNGAKSVDDSTMIEDLGAGVGQSMASRGGLGKKLAVGFVNQIRKTQGKPELTEDQITQAGGEVGKAFDTITNWATDDQKDTAAYQVGNIGAGFMQGSAMGAPVVKGLSSIPKVGAAMAKAPVVSSIAKGALAGLEGQTQYDLTAEGRLPTVKEGAVALGLGAASPVLSAIGKNVPAIKQGISKVGEAIAKKGDDVFEAGVSKVMGQGNAQKKLFKAASPRLNLLNKSTDFKKLEQNHAIASEEIVKHGYLPTDTDSRAVAHADTMQKIWDNEVKPFVGDGFTIDLGPTADAIEEYAKKTASAGIIKNEGQIKELLAQAKKFRKMGVVDAPKAELIKQHVNAQINNRGDSTLGDVYKNGLTAGTKALGTTLDDTLSKIPGEFSDAKRKFGALKATFEDVLKADLKNKKAKGLGLTETFARIEGAGDILGALGGIASGQNPFPGLLKGTGKVLVGKALAKMKDSDFLVKKGFEELSKMLTKTK